MLSLLFLLGMPDPKHDAYLCSCCSNTSGGCWDFGSCLSGVLLRSFRMSVSLCTSLQYGCRPSTCSIVSCCTHCEKLCNILAHGHVQALQIPKCWLLLVFPHLLGVAYTACHPSGSFSSRPPSGISPCPSAGGFGPAVLLGLSPSSWYRFGSF